ncbi:MAG: hypothetical protein ABSE72_00615 [Bacteroidales bacterium]|jgi:hypothetical protein
MRRTVKIFALILLYFLACGKSCDNDEQSNVQREQEKITAETDSLQLAFGADTLSSSSLLAYLETAKQKFYDFNDYLRIVTDTSIAGPFRDKTREMIRNLFITGAEPAKNINPFRLDSVGIKETFHRINDSVYEGSLDFTYRSLRRSDKFINSSQETETITIYLIKRDKNFGKKKLWVWNVFLGKIE